MFIVKVAWCSLVLVFLALEKASGRNLPTALSVPSLSMGKRSYFTGGILE